MDVSLEHLKKVLKFGILLVGISFVDLKSGFGACLKNYHSGIIRNNIFPPLASLTYSANWEKQMISDYGSEALVRQSIVPSAMVDTKGDLYTISFTQMYHDGAWYYIIKNHYSNTPLGDIIKPWDHANCLSLKTDYDKNFFKNYVHNAFQPCIAQEVGNYSPYLYVFIYVPPTRYIGKTEEDDDEGILMLKIKKSDLSVVSQTFYPGGQNRDNYFSFNHQRPRRDSDSYAFGAEFGNYQAWVDTDDSDTDHVHLNWLALEAMDNFSTCNTYHLYNGNVSVIESDNEFPAGGRFISSRAIKYGNYVYTANRSVRSQFGIVWFSKDSYQTAGTTTWGSSDNSPFSYIAHDGSFNDHFAPCYDFCIVENGNTPIFCILGLRATSNVYSPNTYLAEGKSDRWKKDYHNLETSEIVLILSSNTSLSNLLRNPKDAAEDPQNIIYSTGKTTAQSCSTTCDCYSSTYDDYGENQLFKNTHKLVTYTSESGSKYIIYCYCYPGKSKQLFLGYAPYIISNNKVQLLTKTEFKSPPTTTYPMGESFGNFTSCSRIISMDLKNGYLWITWMDADNKIYYCFHIAAKDLVGE